MKKKYSINQIRKYLKKNIYIKKKKIKRRIILEVYLELF